MLKAYCDCSKKEEALAITAIIVTKRLFIDYDLRVLSDVKMTAHGELCAMQLALELINRNFNTPQEIIIYSDCESVVRQFGTTLETGLIPRNRAYYEDWVKLSEMAAGHTVTAKYIRGHEKQRTYHTICDYSARAMI